MRLDPVLVIAAAGVLGGYFVTTPLATGATVVALGVVVGRRVSARVLLCAAVALSVTGWRAWRAVPAFEADLVATRIALKAPSRCSGVARVDTSPTVRDGALGYVADFDALDCEGRNVPGVRVRLREGPPFLARGDRIEVVAQLAPAELFRNAELPDPTPGAARTGVLLSGSALSVRLLEPGRGFGAVIDRARAVVRARIDATFTPLAAPLARALVLGENDLTDEDNAAFRASGLAHLLAVSGTHLVFAVLGVVRALVFILARIEWLAVRVEVGRVAAAAGAVLAPVYADFAGSSGSARRAAWMLAVGLGARALGRHPCAVRLFALSLAVGALLDPLMGFDVSFVLSAAATAGLLVLGKPLLQRLAPASAGKLRRLVASPFAATIAAMIPCAPILATLGPRLTFAGIVANVAAVPFGEAISLPLCLVHALVPGGAVARGLALVASGALLVVRWLAHASASATWLAVPVPPPGPWHFAVIGVAAAGMLVAGERNHAARRAWLMGGLCGFLLVEVAAVRRGHPRGELRITALDVGQGDSTLVDLPDGKLMLIDGGGFVGSPVNPGNSVLLPVLRARRRTRVDIVVLTHPHPDHFLGLFAALPSLDVGEFWDTGQGREQGAGTEYAELIRGLLRRGVPIRGPDVLCGPERTVGGAKLRVFAPCPAFDPVLGPNDNSFVIRLTYGNERALLMGDAEHEEERFLLGAFRSELRADFLKVGHHGSRTSTSAAFLAAVHPRLATVSCGVRNRFGHPSPDTLATLARAGVVALRTDVFGSAEFRTDGHDARARVFGATLAERWSSEVTSSH